MSDANAVQARMTELARKFVGRTLDDITQMRRALAGLDDGTGGGLELIRQLAHRACGTGGTLGLLRVSDAAGDLERLIDAMPADKVPDDASRKRIAAVIDDLATQIEMQ
jgi:HPt (histidine-containing phosphotransfer) domain-containing protein